MGGGRGGEFSFTLECCISKLFGFIRDLEKMLCI